MNTRSIAPGLLILKERKENFCGECTLKYILFSSAAECSDNTVYSMAVVKKSGGGEEFRDFVYDVTRNEVMAHEIFDHLAEGLVTPISFRDVIEDLITE